MNCITAIRKTYEEAGLLIGQHGTFSTTKADLARFCRTWRDAYPIPSKLLARAVTPLGRVRRFDTHSCRLDATTSSSIYPIANRKTSFRN